MPIDGLKHGFELHALFWSSHRFCRPVILPGGAEIIAAGEAVDEKTGYFIPVLYIVFLLYAIMNSIRL